VVPTFVDEVHHTENIENERRVAMEMLIMWFVVLRLPRALSHSLSALNTSILLQVNRRLIPAETF
jgi:hypothetical protein